MSRLTETWSIHNRINLFLLEGVSSEGWAASVPKVRPVGKQFEHIHNVRLMWLKAAAPNIWETQVKLERANKEETMAALVKSAEAMSQLIERSEPTGKVKNFKPHLEAFLGYIISHESHHRGQIEAVLRICGHPIDDKTSFGLWEWGVR